jgi:hypothetical protein
MKLGIYWCVLEGGLNKKIAKLRVCEVKVSGIFTFSPFYFVKPTKNIEESPASTFCFSYILTSQVTENDRQLFKLNIRNANRKL